MTSKDLEQCRLPAPARTGTAAELRDSLSNYLCMTFNKWNPASCFQIKKKQETRQLSNI